MHFSQIEDLNRASFLNSNQYISNLINSGARGVQLFFIVSGFALSYNFQKYQNVPFGLTKYFGNRFFRIYPLWVLTVVLYKLFGLTNEKLLLNLTFVFGLLRWENPSPEIVIGGWSLFAEVIFYMLLPIILKIVKGSNRRIVILVLATIAIRVVWLKTAPQLGIPDTNSFVGLFPASNLYCFLLGIATFQIWTKKVFRSSKKDKLEIIALTSILLFLLTAGSVDQVFISCMFAVLLFKMLALSRKQNSRRSLIESFGRYCYPIYLFQFLVIEVFLMQNQTKLVSLTPFASLMCFLLFAMGMLFLGYVTDRFFERPIRNIGKKVLERLD